MKKGDNTVDTQYTQSEVDTLVDLMKLVDQTAITVYDKYYGPAKDDYDMVLEVPAGVVYSTLSAAKESLHWLIEILQYRVK